MPKYHIEIDSEVIITSIFEIEADTLEAAIEMAEDFKVNPTGTMESESDYIGPDMTHCYEIKPEGTAA